MKKPKKMYHVESKFVFPNSKWKTCTDDNDNPLVFKTKDDAEVWIDRIMVIGSELVEYRAYEVEPT